jgi:tetratricopeptide (TPR) repeat protein
MNAADNARRLADAAKKLYDKKDYSAAADQFRQAADIFRTSGSLSDAAEMDNNRAVALTMGKEYQSAYEAALGTEQVFLAAGEKGKAGLAFGNQAAALEGLGKTREALDLYQRSVELLKTAGDTASLSAVWKSMTALQARTGDSFQALASAQAALNTGAPLSIREKFLKKLVDIPFRMIARR